jgi:excisionase family DNA binding protein
MDGTDSATVHEVRHPARAYVGMSTHTPLTLTVEQAAEVLGIGRSTAYELARNGDLKCIRLRRRIVVPVAHLAESLGVDRDAVWATLTRAAHGPESPASAAPSGQAITRRRPPATADSPALF